MVSKAPGRICLFGDHQDYLGLPIIACAINKYLTIQGVKNSSQHFNIALPDIGNIENLRLDESNAKIEKGQHLKAVLKVVHGYGCCPTQGYDIEISGNIPINAGLSSSSALVVAWTHWLLTTFGCNVVCTPLLIAQIAYEAEVVEQNSPGGKMDQFSIALGHVIFLQTDETEKVALLENSIEGLVVGESGIPKNTIGLLGNLKQDTLKAIALVNKTYPEFNIKNATLDDYDAYKGILPDSLRDFFYGAIQNHIVTQKAVVQLKKNRVDYHAIGSLMNAHHTVLKERLKITVPKIDAMIDAALKAGAYGAKIVGSGGGGSIVALSPKGREEIVISAMKTASAKAAYMVEISKGVQTEK